MTATLRAMKAAAESSHPTGAGQDSAHPGLADGTAARLVEWHAGTLPRCNEGATPPRRRAWPSR